jgi:hypothetical protein
MVIRKDAKKKPVLGGCVLKALQFNRRLGGIVDPTGITSVHLLNTKWFVCCSLILVATCGY